MSGRKRQRVVSGLRKRPRPAVVSDGTKALRLVKKLNRQRENKIHTETIETTVTTFVRSLAEVAEGSEGGQRDGLAIVGKTLQISGSVRTDSRATPAAKYCHIGIVVDQQQVASGTPSWGTIWDNNAADGPMLDRENIKRFKVLYNRRFLLDRLTTFETTNLAPPATNTVEHTHKTMGFSKIIRLKDLDMRWQSALGTSTQKNGIYITFSWAGDDGSGAVANTCKLTAISRLHYIDP